MSQPILTFASLLLHFQSAFSKPAFYRFFLLSVGWLIIPGRHAITSALIALGLSGTLHHAAFHSFFSRGNWNAEALGQHLFRLLLTLLPEDSVLAVIIDDTAVQRRGPRVFGTGPHHDAVRSSHSRKVLLFGHCWVVLSLVIQLPGLPRPYALPLLFRLYRNKKRCPEDEFKTKTQLARDLIDRIQRWAPRRTIHLMLDGAYCVETVLHDLPDTVVVFGRMRVDADLRGTLADRLTQRAAKSTPRGRLPQKGLPCPKPKALATDPETTWTTSLVQLYGVTRSVQWAEQVACWPRVFGERLLKVVVTAPTKSRPQAEAFFCSHADVLAVAVLESYALRWPTEVTFREMKQFLGFGEIHSWTAGAVRRMVPWVGLLYSLVVVWFSQVQSQGVTTVIPLRPWYRHRRGPSFEDMLRTLQNTLRDPAFLKVLGNAADFKQWIEIISPKQASRRRAA